MEVVHISDRVVIIRDCSVPVRARVRAGLPSDHCGFLGTQLADSFLTLPSNKGRRNCPLTFTVFTLVLLLSKGCLIKIAQGN